MELLREIQRTILIDINFLRGVMRKLILFLFFPILCTSQVNINVSFDEKIFKPKNYVKNPSFEEKASWREYASKLVDGKWEKTDIIGFYTDKEKFKGNYSYKINGKRGINAGISQDVNFDKPVSPGNYIYLTYRIKTDNITNEGGPVGISICAYFSDGSSLYLPISIPKAKYRWDEIKKKYQLEKELKGLTLYCLYYDQEGECYFDDIFLTIPEKTKMKYNVKGEDLKRIKIYGEDGKIFDTGDLKKGTDEYNGEIEILGVGYYLFEVEDYKGNIYRKIYPEKKTETIVPMLDEEIIEIGEKRTYKFDFKKEDKKYIIELKARLLSEKISFGGHSPALIIFVNGERIKIDRILDRKEKFTMADGRICSTGRDVFTVYYACGFYIHPEDNPYLPVDIPENDPYKFKFDITDLLKDGKNEIIIGNNSQIAKLVISDLKIKGEEK